MLYPSKTYKKNTKLGLAGFYETKLEVLLSSFLNNKKKKQTPWQYQSHSFKAINCNTDVQAERSKMEQLHNYIRLTQTSCQVADFFFFFFLSLNSHKPWPIGNSNWCTAGPLNLIKLKH